jgi:aminoglycoside phosphotransferase (APT) family kinase protein
LRAEAPAVVFTHGDFWLGNLLGTEKGDLLTGVVDWKFADPEGLPLLDLLQLLLGTKGMHSGTGFTRSLTERLVARKFEDDEKALVEEYCGVLGISDRSIWHLVFMAWLEWVYRRTSMQGYLPSWRQREMDGFLEAASKLSCATV